ncbi:metallophos domain-containing protein, partial [Haematococcus lacustris]
MVVLVDHQLMLGQKLGDQLAAWATGVSPYAAKLDVLQQQCQQREREAAELAAQKEQLMQQLADLEEADRALGRGGLQSYVLEGLLGELQDLCGAYLAQLCDGMVLELSATTSRLKSGAATPVLSSSPAAITAGQAGQSQPAAATNASEIRGRAAGEAAADEGEELEGGEQATEGEATGRKQRGRARGSRGAQQGRPKESRAEAEGLREEISLAVAESGARGESSRRHTLLTLAGVTIEGYGPFRQAQTYTLADKGLRALTGRNEDDGGASSNGAGKSSLVSAPLWA